MTRIRILSQHGWSLLDAILESFWCYASTFSTIRAFPVMVIQRARFPLALTNALISEHLFVCCLDFSIAFLECGALCYHIPFSLVSSDFFILFFSLHVCLRFLDLSWRPNEFIIFENGRFKLIWRRPLLWNVCNIREMNARHLVAAQRIFTIPIALCSLPTYTVLWVPAHAHSEPCTSCTVQLNFCPRLLDL